MKFEHWKARFGLSWRPFEARDKSARARNEAWKILRFPMLSGAHDDLTKGTR